MAQRLHSEFGYSYDNVKVLQGGWNAWLENNATDQTGYPIGTGAGGGAAAPTTAP
ncbi:MAG TPA: hypothetical protein VF826_05470 [Chloroflexia bacterium]